MAGPEGIGEGVGEVGRSLQIHGYGSAFATQVGEDGKLEGTRVFLNKPSYGLCPAVGLCTATVFPASAWKAPASDRNKLSAV